MLDPLEALRAEIEEVAADDSQEVAVRTARLMEFRGDLVSLLGSIDTYVGDNAVEADGSRAPEVQEAVERLRENADIRETLLGRGMSDPAVLDDLMIWSHEELDKLAEEGLLEESALTALAFGREAAKFTEGKHPRGRGGKWIDVLGKVSKLKEGDRVHVGNDVHMKNVGGQFQVSRAGRTVSKHTNVESAARAAHAATQVPASKPAPADEGGALGTKEPVGTGAGETGKTSDWIRSRGDVASPEDAAKAKAGVASTAAEQTLPDEEKSALYNQRRTELERKAAASVARAAATGGLTDAEAHFNEAGRVSQRTLARYVEEAATKPQTTDLYSKIGPDGTRVWDESRRQLHEKIIGAMLRERVTDPTTGKQVLSYDAAGADLAPHPDGPKVLFSGGGYAAGKGASLKLLAARGELPAGSFTLDPDQIKAELPEFQAMIGTDPEANMHVYREAWAIAQEVQARAMQRKVSMVVDGISDTSPEEMGQRAKAFTDRGYDARVVYTDIPTEEALSRAANRAVNAKDDSDRRMIPEVIMRSVHRDVASTVPSLPGYLREHNIPLSVEVYDNNQGKDENGFRPPKLMHSYDPATQAEQVHDQHLWDSFRNKASEPIRPAQGVEA